MVFLLQKLKSLYNLPFKADLIYKQSVQETDVYGYAIDQDRKKKPVI